GSSRDSPVPRSGDVHIHQPPGLHSLAVQNVQRRRWTAAVARTATQARRPAQGRPAAGSQ
ncbi:MAG: hypothetical protein WBA70_03130, partial [Thermodesulfobacteriota bacterium]